MKFLIITDSVGNPRVFPEAEMTRLEETYPYILREHFKDAVFWQLSYGNVTTEQLVSQVASYMSNWKPDYVIVHSGINDARPEAFSDVAKNIIYGMSGPLFGTIKQLMHKPSLVKLRKVFRVSPASFKKTAQKLRFLFEDSTVLWLEIAVDKGYERVRPGVLKRVEEYNQILKKIYGDNVVMVHKPLLDAQGYNADSLHWNKKGHDAVAGILLKTIKR